MEPSLDTLKTVNLDLSGIPPVNQIIRVVLSLIITQALRRFLSAAVIQPIENLTAKTQSSVDDELIFMIKPANN